MKTHISVKKALIIIGMVSSLVLLTAVYQAPNENPAEISASAYLAPESQISPKSNEQLLIDQSFERILTLTEPRAAMKRDEQEAQHTEGEKLLGPNESHKVTKEQKLHLDAFARIME